MNNPKQTVVISFVGVMILTGGGKVLSGHLPTYRQLMGTFILFVILGVGVEIAPEVAATLALLVLLTAALENFGAIAPAIKKLVG